MIEYVTPPVLSPDVWTSRARRRVIAGVDLAFVADGCALVIIERLDERIVTVEHDFRLPKPGRPLDPIEITSEYLDRIVARGGQHVIADGHYLELMRHAANKRGVTLHSAPHGDARLQSWITTRHYTRDRKISFPREIADHMRKIRATARDGGGMSITAARGDSTGHADLAFALAAAVYLDSRLHGVIGNAITEVKTHRGAWSAP